MVAHPSSSTIRYQPNARRPTSLSHDAFPHPPLVGVLFYGVRLGLVLLHERYKTSPSAWEPYISNLPKRLKGVPLASFGAVEMRGMQDIVLAGKIDQR